MDFKDYLKEALNRSKPDMTLDDISVKIPFVYKKEKLYLDNNKIGDFINNELVVDKNAVNDYMNFDNCVNYFDAKLNASCPHCEESIRLYGEPDLGCELCQGTGIAEKLIENKAYMIEIEWVDIYNIKTEKDYLNIGAGREEEVLTATDYEVYYDRFPITKLLSEEDLEKIRDMIEQKLMKRRR